MAPSVAGRANWRRQNLDSATLLHTGQKVIILISLLIFIIIQIFIHITLTVANLQSILNLAVPAKIVKFLNQCFAQLRYPKSVCKAGTVGFVNSRHFSDIEVVQNTDLRI